MALPDRGEAFEEGFAAELELEVDLAEWKGAAGCGAIAPVVVRKTRLAG